MSALEHDIKTLIIESLGLEDIGVEDIDSTAPLFGDGLGLDSIDALELGVALQKRFNIRLDAHNSQNKEHFRSVQSLAQFVAAQQGAA